MKRNTIIAIMITFCFTASIFMIIPIRSATSPYNPWVDINDDGKISLQDLVLLANSYGTTGTPLTKASIQFDSGWINITDKCGQNIIVTHGLNSTDIMVDVQGKTTADGGTHQRYYGLTPYMPGWSKTYGGTNANVAYALVQTSDGGYALAGYTNSFGAGGYDFWLVKTDSNGNMQWNKTYGGTGDDEAAALVQTTDGGYALAGYTNSFGAGGYDFWLVKTDSNGNMQWNKTYGGSGNDYASDLVRTSDGG
jgi:predicted secreted protein